MKYLHAIKIIHDRKNRGLYNIIAEFFRFIGVFVLEDAPGYLNDTQKTDDTQFNIYLADNEKKLSSMLNGKKQYSIIFNNQKLNSEINNLTLEKSVLDAANVDLKELFKSIFEEIQKSGIIVPSNVIGDLLPIYLNANIVIAASNLQYYRIVSVMHEKSKNIFQDAVEELNALYNVTNGVAKEDIAQAEFHYHYSLLYCKYKVNLACWFMKNGEYNRRRGDGELCDANGFRREVQLQYKVFDLVEECRKLLAKYPQEPNLYVLLGLITERASDGYSICVDAYTRALQSIGEQPYASHVYYWLGRVHEKYKEKNIPTNLLLSGFRKSFYQTATRYIIGKEPTLELFNGKIFNDIIAKYKQVSANFENITKKELFAKVRSGQVRAQQFAAGPVRHQLEYAGQMPHGLSLAQFTELEGGNGHVKTLFPRLFLGKTHVRHFGRGENAGRHHVIFRGLVPAKAVLHRHERFGHRHVGEHDARGPQNVAYGIHAGHAGFQFVIHRNVAAPVRGDARLGQAQPVGVGHAAHGNEDGLGFQRALLSGGGGNGVFRQEGRRAKMGDNRAVPCFRGIDSAAQLHGDARLFHLALDQLMSLSTPGTGSMRVCPSTTVTLLPKAR